MMHRYFSLLQWKPLNRDALELTDANYNISCEFVSKTLVRLTEYAVYPSPD